MIMIIFSPSVSCHSALLFAHAILYIQLSISLSFLMLSLSCVFSCFLFISLEFTSRTNWVLQEIWKYRDPSSIGTRFAICGCTVCVYVKAIVMKGMGWNTSHTILQIWISENREEKRKEICWLWHQPAYLLSGLCFCFVLFLWLWFISCFIILLYCIVFSVVWTVLPSLLLIVMSIWFENKWGLYSPRMSLLIDWLSLSFLPSFVHWFLSIWSESMPAPFLFLSVYLLFLFLASVVCYIVFVCISFRIALPKSFLLRRRKSLHVWNALKINN